MRRLSALLVAGVLGLAACGDDGGGDGGTASAPPAASGDTRTTDAAPVATASPEPEASTRAEVLQTIDGFDPQRIYTRDAPGVVTIYSVFGGLLGGGGGGQGSGFVLNERGEIVTNAHVVTTGEQELRSAEQVFVEFSDGNRVEAEIVGADPNADIALIRIDPDGLDLKPLRLGASDEVEVGEPVAAIGSPFGERQSLSVGVVSAVDRAVESLTDFQISGAVQTDAAINPGNSGGPLVNADGEVIGVNQSIRTNSGGGEGVGFAVPVDTVKRSVEQLREKGRVDYAYIGVSSTPLYPQLAERFDLPVQEGAWLQSVTPGGPADDAGLRGGGEPVRFQAQAYNPGGDIISRIEDAPIEDSDDLSEIVARFEPGEDVRMEIYRDGKRRTVTVTLGRRPAQAQAG